MRVVTKTAVERRPWRRSSAATLTRMAGRPALVAVLAVLVLFPAGTLLYATFRSESPVYPDATWTLDTWTSLGSESFRKSLRATAILAAVVGVGATLLGAVFAWLVVRTDLPFRRLLEWVLFVPLLFSPFVLATGWIAAFRPNAGLANIWVVRPLFGTEVNIYSWFGIGIVMISYLTPVPFLFIAGALRSMDGSLEEASTVAGGGRLRTLRHVTFPLVLPSIAAAGLLVLVTAAEMFSVPALLGRPFHADNLAVWIYDRILSTPPNWPSAAAGGTVLIAVVAIGVWLNRRILRLSHKYSTISGKASRPRTVQLGPLRPLAIVFVWGYAILCIVIPLLGIVTGSLLTVRDPSQLSWSSFNFDNYHFLFTPRVVEATRNTLALAVGTPLTIVAVTLASAWVVARSGGRMYRGAVDFLNTLPLAFPGIVLGVAVLWAYFPIVWLPIYGTVLLLFVAYWGRYLPHSYRNLSSAIIQQKPELDEASRVAGARPAQTFRFVTLPLMRPVLTYTYIYLFIEVSKEVTTAVILGAAGGVRALAPLMWDTLTEGSLGHAYVLSVLQLCITGIVLLLAQRLLGVRLGSTSR